MINNVASDVRKIGEHKFTVEMNDIIDAIQVGLSLKGFAYAGAGKSTLLRSIEKYHSKKYGLYICYNKSLEREAKKILQYIVNQAKNHADQCWNKTVIILVRMTHI